MICLIASLEERTNYLRFGNEQGDASTAGTQRSARLSPLCFALYNANGEENTSSEESDAPRSSMCIWSSKDRALRA